MIRLHELREKRGLSMKDVAKSIGIPYTTYVNYEKGTLEPNIETLFKLAEFFGVTIDALLGHCTPNERLTLEEAINILSESKRQNEVMRDNPSTFWASHQMADGVKNAERRIAALDLALSALRPVSREQVEKVWAGCEYCEKHKINLVRIEMNYYASPGSLERLNPTRVPKFCPMCGAPMTDEAVERRMERLEALKDGSTTD